MFYVLVFSILAVVLVVGPESPVLRAATLMELPFHRDAEAARRGLQQR